MIFVNEKDSCGSGRFTDVLFASIRPTLAKHFNKEVMNDFDDDLTYQKMIWLDELNKDDFAFIFDVIKKAEIDEKWRHEQTVLVDMLQADPRFNLPCVILHL